jgi:hypothetical protein
LDIKTPIWYQNYQEKLQQGNRRKKMVFGKTKKRIKAGFGFRLHGCAAFRNKPTDGDRQFMM